MSSRMPLDVEVILADRRQYKGRVVATDPKTDVAVVKIQATNLLTVPWGDSSNLAVGDFVLAIGNPLGLSRTVTFGIVSAVGRADVGVADFEDFIQTDAPINPGNSGGALGEHEWRTGRHQYRYRQSHRRQRRRRALPSPVTWRVRPCKA